jgi:hypothetical protein
MSNLLWRFYLEDNVDKFKSLLANGHYTPQYASKGHGGGPPYSTSLGIVVGSPGSGFGISPRTPVKNRKSSGHAGNMSGTKGQNNAFSRADLNCRDQSGLTILHRAVSSTSDTSLQFAMALIEHPNVDLYLQDLENGWTALHRALYFGNITIARTLMERDAKDAVGQGASSMLLRANALIKVKDFEGNSPFDVYNATIARRTLEHRDQTLELDSDEEEEEGSVADVESGITVLKNSVDGDEIFAFGSNKNLTLGFGDEDDRQHPEKILLKRPDHLLFRFYEEYLLSAASDPSSIDSSQVLGLKSISDLPSIIRNRPIVIQDVCLSKVSHLSFILRNIPEYYQTLGHLVQPRPDLLLTSL